VFIGPIRITYTERNEDLSVNLIRKLFEDWTPVLDVHNGYYMYDYKIVMMINNKNYDGDNVLLNTHDDFFVFIINIITIYYFSF
jgi:hypothetical protein